jgi:hypothetical protein
MLMPEVTCWHLWDGHFGRHRIDGIDALLQHIAGAKHGAMILHGALHAVADLRRRAAALRATEKVEPRQRTINRGRSQRFVANRW